MLEHNNNDLLIDMGIAPTPTSIIKVIGVGGGGSNAVNHMYREGIHDVNFVVCNTDSKALCDSPVPTRLQLGKEGLGAGNNPLKALEAAEESIEDIRQMLTDGTKMVFVTAGMGGGTGTGAAPIVAREARKLGILTVGIVTIPFLFEGIRKIDQALEGVENIAKHVDALLVINNERLREIYPDLNVLSAFEKADNTLSIAARSIAEIITMRGVINLDFRDVGTVLKDGGVAIISTGYGEGENRVTKAIEDALNSPLINSRDIFNSKKVLLSITFCKENEGELLMMDEINEVHDFMSKLQRDVETKWGLATDPSLGKKVKITILATGFGVSSLPGMKEKMKEKSEEQAAEEAEREADKNEIREIYYPNGNKEAGKRKRPKVYLFRPEDLDNEEIISLVEVTPTYKRTKELFNEIRNKAQGTVAIEPMSTDNATIISFN